MVVSRRKFIKSGALLGMFAAAPMAALASPSNHCADPEMQMPLAGRETVANNFEGVRDQEADTLASLTQASFTRQLNSRFELQRDAGSASVPLVLTRIFDFKAECGHAGTSRITLESFSLNFSCTRGIDLLQDVYTLKHAELGSFALLLVPAGHESKTYQAVINRLHV